MIVPAYTYTASASAAIHCGATVKFVDIITENAKRAGMKIAEFMRDQAIHRPIKISYPIVVDLPELQKLTDQFACIANNLNQIARHFNMGGLHSLTIRQEINECVMELMKMRKAVMDMAGDFHGSWNMD